MGFLNDIRFAARLIVRRPTVPLLVAGLFALGVGLASGMWAVVDAALVRPLRIERMVRLSLSWRCIPSGDSWPSRPPTSSNGQPGSEVWKRSPAGIRSMRASQAAAANRSACQPQKSRTDFRRLGVPPLLGRALQSSDFAREERVAVLGYAVWTAHFRRDPHVIGKVIHVDDEAYTVVGVMPEHFVRRVRRSSGSRGRCRPRNAARGGSSRQHSCTAGARAPGCRCGEGARGSVPATRDGSS